MNTATSEKTAGPATDSMAEPVAGVNTYLASVVEDRPFPANLSDAIRYALLGPGKRLRPILVIRSAQAAGGGLAMAMPAAAAIEMIHCFSLVHDDLPAMDDDDLRRGRPTLHRHTNEAMAILVGDALTALAFEVVTTRLSPPAVAAAVAKELAKATNDMIAGQVYDTLGGFDPGQSPQQQLRTTHVHKTAALIRCSCRMGAICADADAAQIDALTRYGEAIGLMFQVVDDLLDVTQTTEHLGKTSKKDADQGKMTYPGVVGIESSRTEIERLQKQALEALEPFGEAASPLRELCEYMSVRTR